MILDEILETKIGEVAAARARESVEALRDRPAWQGPRRGFRSAIADADDRSIIAEIKRASPSKGRIRDDFDPAVHAGQYTRAGARCISVLTDERYFEGSLAHFEAARAATDLPMIRKDFTIDPYQIVEARAYGADAVLLIVAALDAGRLAELLAAATDEGLDALVEVHDSAELDVALAADATLIGVNNRNLRTFETSLHTSRSLAARVPDGIVLVSESGFRHPHELGQLEAVGVNAFLIGEALMRAKDPEAALNFFMGRGPVPDE